MAWQRRLTQDRSQALRRTVQALFFALNVWVAVEFLVWVKYYESGGRTAWAARPAGVEGWLPIASLMNLKVLLYTGQVPVLHPAGMFLLIAFVGISWVFRKTFCSWLCPVGTISEWLWRLGRETFGRNWVLPRWLDIPLRGLKYALFGLFMYAVVSMPVGAIRAFLDGPYGVVADVKMLNFFRFMGLGGAVTLGVLVVLSVLVKNFWCRYLCPYGALMGLIGTLSPVRIRRNEAACINCAKCTRECPSLLPVGTLVQIRSAECTGCLQCIAVCPAESALEFRAVRRWRVPAWAVAAGLAVVFLGVCGYAQWRGSWRTDLPSQVYMDLVPRAQEFTHP